MANRFWVGGGSANTWAATGNTNWSTTSGGANNASVPTTTDVAIFDSNSGSGNSVIGASTTIQGLECDGSTAGTGVYAGTLTHNTSVTLTINSGLANSLRLTSGMTYTPASITSLVTFTNTSGTAQLKSYGKAFAAITMNGVGGTCQQQDTLNINAVQNSALTITNGVWDCNSNALTSNLVLSNNSNTRSFLLGGTVTIGSSATSSNILWNFATLTGLTFTKNSANIVILPPTTNSQQYWGFNSGTGLSYNNLTLNASTVGTAEINIVGANTFANLNIGSGWTVALPSNATQTITNAFTWNGTQANPILVGCALPGVNATLSVPSGACSLSWGGLSGITGTGGATFTATNTMGFPPTSTGWVISPPADSSSAGIAAAVWKDLLSSSDFATAGSVGALLAALVNLQYTVQSIGRGTVTTGASTTSIPSSAFAPATSPSVPNQLVGRVVLFDYNTTTVALRGQVATISAVSASATPTLTVTTGLTATPASGDLFSVI